MFTSCLTRTVPISVSCPSKLRAHFIALPKQAQAELSTIKRSTYTILQEYAVQMKLAKRLVDFLTQDKITLSTGV